MVTTVFSKKTRSYTAVPRRTPLAYRGTPEAQAYEKEQVRVAATNIGIRSGASAATRTAYKQRDAAVLAANPDAKYVSATGAPITSGDTDLGNEQALLRSGVITEQEFINRNYRAQPTVKAYVDSTQGRYAQQQAGQKNVRENTALKEQALGVSTPWSRANPEGYIKLGGSDRFTNSYERKAAEISFFLTKKRKQGDELAASIDADPVGRTFKGRVAYRTERVIGYGLQGASNYFARYATHDPSLGKEIVLSYAGGRVLGTAFGESTNYFVNRQLATRGGNAALLEYDAAKVITGAAGGGLLVGSFYGRSGTQIAEGLPLLALGGVAGSRSYNLAGVGEGVTAFNPVSASRPNIRYEANTLSGTQQRVIGVEGYSFGKTFTTTAPEASFFSGLKGKGKYAIEGTSAGYFDFPTGKRSYFNNQFSGGVSRGVLGVKDIYGNLFVSRFTQTNPKATVGSDFGLNPSEFSAGKSIFGTFKGGVLQSAGRGVGVTQTEVFTTRYRDSFFELPGRGTKQIFGNEVTRGELGYFPRSLYNKGSLLAGEQPVSLSSKNVLLSKRGSLGNELAPLDAISKGRSRGKGVVDTPFSLRGLPVVGGRTTQSSVLTTTPLVFDTQAFSLDVFSSSLQNKKSISLPKTSTASYLNAGQRSFSLAGTKPLSLQKPLSQQRPVTLQMPRSSTMTDFSIPTGLTPPPFIGLGAPLSPFLLPTGSRSFDKGAAGRSFSYVPSLAAIFGNVRGKQSKVLGGFEVRPLAPLKRKKKRG